MVEEVERPEGAAEEAEDGEEAGEDGGACEEGCGFGE